MQECCQGQTLQKFMFDVCVCFFVCFVSCLCRDWFCGFDLRKGLDRYR